MSGTSSGASSGAYIGHLGQVSRVDATSLQHLSIDIIQFWAVHFLSVHITFAEYKWTGTDWRYVNPKPSSHDPAWDDIGSGKEPEEYMYRDIYKPEWKETKLMAPTKTKILGQQAIVITGGGVHPCVGSQCDDS